MKDKVVIITGGSSGIGRALAEEFGSRGSKLLITGRSQEQLDKTVADLRGKGIVIESFVSDVSIEEDNRQMAQAAKLRFGTIDVLINNAGISMRALFEEVDLEVIKKVMDINFYGVLYATKYCLPEIIKNKGSVVGISSIAGYRGLPGRAGYSASKFALQGWLESIRTELMGDGVHVMWVCPGFTTSNIRNAALDKKGESHGESPMDEGSMMSAEECAEHILSAITKKKRTIVLTFTGKRTVIMNKFFPRLADKLVRNFFFKDGKLVK